MAPVDRWILGAALAVRVRRTSCCVRSTSYRGRDRRWRPRTPLQFCSGVGAAALESRPAGQALGRRQEAIDEAAAHACQMQSDYSGQGCQTLLERCALGAARPTGHVYHTRTLARTRAHRRTLCAQRRTPAGRRRLSPPGRWAAGPLRCGQAGVSCVVCRLAGCSPLAAVWSPRARPAAAARASCTLAVPLRGPVGKTGCLELAEHGTRSCASNVQQDSAGAPRAEPLVPECMPDAGQKPDAPTEGADVEKTRKQQLTTDPL